MKDKRVWIFLGSLVILGMFVFLPGFLRKPPAFADEKVPIIHYVCRESGEVFERPPDGELCAHPKTGQMTLVPAIYDARRKSWRPGPPLAVMRQMGKFHTASQE